MSATFAALTVDTDSLFGPSECSFCGQPNHLPAGGDHPCCTFARADGHARCEGCTNYAVAETNTPRGATQLRARCSKVLPDWDFRAGGAEVFARRAEGPS